MSNRIKINVLSSILFILLLSGCKTQDAITEVIIEEDLLDTLTVSAPKYVKDDELPILPIYNPSASRSYDIKHTALRISFDWEKEQVIGIATLALSPYFYAIDEIILDAKNFEINEITLDGNPLMYEYEYDKITIYLPRSYTKDESIEIVVDYVATPGAGVEGGSEYITSDKGLFFINPRGEDKNKPRQIWTQGETENNHRWFPTFDKPNERMSQEIWLTVNDTLQTLSNGKLVSSYKNGDGTRTDYWKQDKPHAPYLAMVAVGDFARIKEIHNGLLLEYLVDPPYKEYAKEIFNHTPEMIDFFSQQLKTPFPWDKYSQLVVEDFVSGAMENTSASVFGDFVQKIDVELMEEDNDNIVAHELFHQWFGNLVTTESWANLTLNEGFANYSEYLWREHKYGKSRAEEHRYDELKTYLEITKERGTHPLIHYSYEDKEHMFDVHSYNKGGLVLHMLRNEVGDKAFYAALEKYLNDNAFTSVEVDELRMAFEDTIGEDLSWFFNQWFHDAGHPILEVKKAYDPIKEIVNITYEQIQSKKEHKEIFVLPVEVAIYDQEGNLSYYPHTIDSRRGEITINDVSEEPALILIDGRNNLLAEIEEFSRADYENLLRFSPHYAHKLTAIENLNDEILVDYLDQLLESNYTKLRLKGVSLTDINHLKKLTMMATDDNNSQVRSLALTMIRRHDYKNGVMVAEEVVKKSEAPSVIATAVSILYEQDAMKGNKLMHQYLKNNGSVYLPYFSDILAYDGSSNHIQYFEKYIEDVDTKHLVYTFQWYKDLVINQEPSVMRKAADRIYYLAQDGNSQYVQYLAKDVLEKIKDIFSEKKLMTHKQEINEMIENLK